MLDFQLGGERQLTKLALEQRSEEGDGAGRRQAPRQAGQSAEALEQVFLVCWSGVRG